MGVPRADVELPADWQQTVPHDPASPAVDLRRWWSAFQDPGLDQLVEAALRDNIEVAEARERLLAARERLYHAEMSYRPQFDARTRDVMDPDASASFFVAGFDATWELDLFGRGTAVNRQASGVVAAGAASLQEVRVSLVGELVRDWLLLRAAQQRTAVLADLREMRQHQLEQAQLRARLRLAGPQTVAQAEADLAQAEAAIAVPQTEMVSLVQQLALLSGRVGPAASWLVPAAVPTLGALRVEQLPAELLRTRPEIAHAEAAVLRAAGDVGVARADLLPRIGLGGSIVWSTNLTAHRDTQSHALVSTGPMIDIPLFDWGAREAELRATRHDLQASVYAYRQAVLQGMAEVETALGQMEQQRRRQVSSAQAQAALKRTARTAATQVKLHLAPPDTQLESQLVLAQASLSLIDATAAHGVAFVSLYKALGGAPLPEQDGADAVQR